VVCEDDASSAYVDSDPRAPGIENVNRLIGITPNGQAFVLAVNTYTPSSRACASARTARRCLSTSTARRRARPSSTATRA
jgi:hypothetical protein